MTFLISVYLYIPSSDLAILNKRCNPYFCFPYNYLIIVEYIISIVAFSYSNNWRPYDNPEQLISLWSSQWYSWDHKSILTKDWGHLEHYCLNYISCYNILHDNFIIKLTIWGWKRIIPSSWASRNSLISYPLPMYLHPPFFDLSCAILHTGFHSHLPPLPPELVSPPLL